jgi:hypothetical protein
MKNFKNVISVFVLVLTVVFFYACSKDSSNPVDPNNVANSNAALTLNGSGYSNKSATLANGLCQYSTPDTETVVQFFGKVDNDSLYLAIIFLGNSTGTYNWNDDNAVVIYRTTSTGNFIYYGITQGTTTISSYGAVNGKIQGSITGKLIEQTSLSELNISGSFSAVRIQDYN